MTPKNEINKKPIYSINGRFKRWGKRVYLQLSKSEQAFLLRNWEDICGWHEFRTESNNTAEEGLIKTMGKRKYNRMKKEVEETWKKEKEQELKKEADSWRI